MKFFVLLAFVLVPVPSHARVVVNKLLSPTLIEGKFEKSDGPILPGNVLLLLVDRDSDGIKEAVASYKVERADGSRLRLEATIQANFEPAVARVGDEMELVDLTKKNASYQGRTALEHTGQRKISSRYKRVINKGFYGEETAETLAKNEHMIELSTMYSYGITDRWMVQTLLLGPLLVKAGTLASKCKILDVESVTLSAGVEWSLVRTPTVRGPNYAGLVYVDMPSNGKFRTHYRASIVNSKVKRKDIKNDAWKESATTESNLKVNSEYIFDNWDRLFFGPSYFVDQKTIGLQIGYLMIWDRYHLSVWMDSKDIKNLKGNAYGFYMYWRI